MSPDAVAAALRDVLVERHGGPIEIVGTPGSNGDGFDSAIYFVRFAGAGLPEPWTAPLVVRVKSRADQTAIAHREARTHDWLYDRGYPVPRVLDVFEPGALGPLPAQVIERAPGVVAIDAVKRAPWTFARTTRALGGLHTKLHRLPTAGFPDDDDLLDRRLSLPRRVVAEGGDDALGDALARVEALAPRLRDAPAVVCHGDFHPLNVLVEDGAMSVIDWSDAGLGDRHGDVARTLLLFEMSRLAAKSRAERAVLRRVGPFGARSYRRAYEAELALDAERLALWRPVHLVQAWAQAIGATTAVFDDGALAARLPPNLLGDLQAMYAEAIAAVSPAAR